MNWTLLILAMLTLTASAQPPFIRSAWQTAARPAAAGGNDAYVTDWLARISAAGGAAPSQGTINALNTFAGTLRTQNLATNMVSMNPIVPDNIIAASTPLIYRTGFGVWSNYGTVKFQPSQLTTNGLIGNATNPTNAYFDTGVDLSIAFGTVTNSLGYTVYYYSNLNTTTVDMGVQNSVGAATLYGNFATTTYFDCWLGSGSGRISASSSNHNGIITANRISNTDTKLYRYSSALPLYQFASGSSTAGRVPTNTVWAYIYRLNNSSIPPTSGNFPPKQLSFIAIHDGLTFQQASNFCLAIQTLRTNLGGGYR